MKFEYLLFNLLIICGPLALSFDHKVNFARKWFLVFIAISVPVLSFIIWDILVTDRHWWFNQNFIVNIYLANLPIEEWLFFISVPFASLFIWEVLATYRTNIIINKLEIIRLIFYLGILVGIWLFIDGREYTALVLTFLGLAAILDRILKTDVFLQSRTYLYLAILSGLVLVFNGYLTARPVVLYEESFKIGFRIFTIPIEDFGYGFALILSSTIIYEKLKGMRRA